MGIENSAGSRVSIRRLPFPYSAMLAICSDLDETPDAATYFDQLEYLNGTHQTPMGAALGLEVGASIYFAMPPGQFSYWSADDAGRSRIRELICSGHVDCLHSFGDTVDSREEAVRALDELRRYGCSLKVWVDHAVAPTNLGADIMRGRGDLPGERAYHSDLTCARGLGYVWRGRVTSVIGQNRPVSLWGIGRWSHPVASLQTLAREFVKQALARLGSRKYGLHRANAVLQPATLRDGTAVHEFLRCNPHWGGVSSCDRGDCLDQVLTASFLDRLIRRRASAVVYTHLGKNRFNRPGHPFTEPACRALQELAQRYRSGTILVATTRRLLDYERMHQEVRVTVHRQGSGVRIDVVQEPDACRRYGPLSEAMLQGLTILVPAQHASAAELYFEGRRIDLTVCGPVDEPGVAAVMVPWKRLFYPPNANGSHT